MITNANQVIPRKSRRLPFKLFLAVFYIAIFFIVFYFDDEEIFTWMILGLLLLSLPVSLIDSYLWRARWQELATQANLGYEKTGVFNMQPQVQGTYRGYGITLDSFSRGSRNRRYYTRFTISFPFDNPESIQIDKRGILDAFGSKNLEIEDHEVSQKFAIRAESAKPVDRLLRHNRIRQALLDLHPQASSLEISISGNGITYHERHRIKDIAYLQAVLDFLIQLAELLKQQAQGFDFDG